MPLQSYDLIVIGTGSAALTAASRCCGAGSHERDGFVLLTCPRGLYHLPHELPGVDFVDLPVGWGVGWSRTLACYRFKRKKAARLDSSN